MDGNPINPQCPAYTTAYLFAEMYNNTGTGRYAVRAYFEVYMDGVYQESRSECLGTIPPGITQLKLDTEPFIIDCDYSYTIETVWLGWTTTPADNCDNATTCKDYNNTKCSKDLTNSYSIVIPLITYTCGIYDENSITVNFTGTPLGGLAPYTYAWDFNNDGTIDATTQNPSYTFNTTSTGDFTVSLKITDAEGAYGTAELDLYLPRITNCDAGPIYLCSDAAPINLATNPGFTATPSGGTGSYSYSSGGTYYTSGQEITSFNPALAGSGTHSLYYIYSDPKGCSDICNFTIVVYPKPELNCPTDPDACPSPTPLELTGVYGVTAIPAGGTGVYSGTGVSESGGKYYLNISNTGTYTINYNYTKDCCSNSCTYTITVTDMGITCPFPNPVTLEGCNTDVIEASGRLPYTETKTSLTYAQFTDAGAISVCGDAGYNYYYQDSKAETCPIVVTRRFFIEVPDGGASVYCDQVINIQDNQLLMFCSVKSMKWLKVAALSQGHGRLPTPATKQLRLLRS